MRPRTLPICFALLFTNAIAFAQSKLDTIDIHRPLPSTALILTRNAMGSGFLVDRQNGMVVTNFHVVENHKTVDVLFPVLENFKAVVTKEYYFKKAPRIQGTVLAKNPYCDLALIQLPRVPGDVPELPLARESPKPGDKSSMVGNPGDASRVWVWAPGEVKQVQPVRMDYPSGQKVQALVSRVLADPKFGPGTSGGPAVNSSGELIGVMAAQSTREPMMKVYIDVTEVRFFLGQVYRDMGTAAMRQTDYPRAIALCSKSIDANSDDPQTYNERGVAYASQGRYGDAITDYSIAVQLDPKYSRAWRNRGSAQLSLGKLEQAVADCSEAIRLDPKYARAYLTRGKALDKLGKADAAQADFQRAGQLDPALKP